MEATASDAIDLREAGASGGWWGRFVDSPLWPATLSVLLLLVWQAYVSFSGTLKVLLPAPSDIVRYLWLHRALLLENAWPTIYQCLLGFALAVVGGIAIAIVITQFKTIRRGFYPLVVVIALTPKISLAPLFTLWFGTNSFSRVALVFFISFFPMVVSPASGLTNVDPGLLRMARSFGASRAQIFWTLRVPSALPHIFDGMKVAISLAVIGIIVAEFVTSETGLGYLIIFATGLLDTTMMLSAIIVLSVIGLFFYFTVEAIARVAVYWQR
ncbi:MAG TPA: ABC transporter permease [Alphaproteobacteria bacterium]|nr:ABC transporter permease [Alphaproteobacteria bacterium]